MGLANGKQETISVQEQVGDEKMVRDNCLSMLFKGTTLERIIGRDLKGYSSESVNRHVNAALDRLANIVLENARKNDGVVCVRVKLGTSNDFLDIVRFDVKSRDAAEKVALQVLILHGLMIEKEGVLRFSFKMDRYARDGNNVVWLEPTISDPLRTSIYVWFDQVACSDIIDDVCSIFIPKIHHPSERVIDELECGIAMNNVQLVGKDPFWYSV